MKRLLQMLGICLAVLLLHSCFDKSKYAPEPYLRPLEIIKLSDQDYMHVSYLKDGKGGYIPCNGYIRKEGDEVFIFDTPIDESTSVQLIDFIKNDLNATIKAVMVSHAHIDAAGGVKAFNEAGIPTYGSSKTAALLARDTITLSNTFQLKDSLMLGKTLIKMDYLGPAHTDDNAIAYLEGPEILLGGCMIKSLEAGKGNLADANLKEWAKTVTTAKYLYPDVKQVIPGHGMRGDSALLTYTIKMFQVEKPIIKELTNTNDQETVQL
ncbi:subclass B1 metallo-beta-lactamase [Dokdonia sp. LLG6352-1]|uniref:subclass B1 metallo-beta-lactamase n=1 Tax=Dokdonia sp. LLG6352-1 TaxID=3160831 RepID=UPI00386A1BFD